MSKSKSIVLRSLPPLEALVGVSDTHDHVLGTVHAGGQALPILDSVDVHLLAFANRCELRAIEDERVNAIASLPRAVYDDAMGKVRAMLAAVA